MLSSPRRPSSTMRDLSLQRNDAGVWLCEYPGLSFQRSPVCACSLVSSLLLSGATMSQQSSLTQSAHSVRQVLTAYTAARLLLQRGEVRSAGHAVALRDDAGVLVGARVRADGIADHSRLLGGDGAREQVPQLKISRRGLDREARLDRDIAAFVLVGIAVGCRPSALVGQNELIA